MAGHDGIGRKSQAFGRLILYQAARTLTYTVTMAGHDGAGVKGHPFRRSVLYQRLNKWPVPSKRSLVPARPRQPDNDRDMI
jgi:hypothetical protein